MTDTLPDSYEPVETDRRICDRFYHPGRRTP